MIDCWMGELEDDADVISHHPPSVCPKMPYKVGAGIDPSLPRMGVISEKHKKQSKDTMRTPLRLLTWNIRYDWMGTPVTPQKVRLEKRYKTNVRNPRGQYVEQSLSAVLNYMRQHTG
jgi:hypothetical protein